jgi:hypothetical protein
MLKVGLQDKLTSPKPTKKMLTEVTKKMNTE